jgi:hypothetical protein
LLGGYTKAEDEAMYTAFDARGKRRLNRVFDGIGFVYPDYRFPARKRGLKRKSAPGASSVAPKQKRVKVLTHQPKSYFLERAAQLPDTGTSETETAKKAEGILPVTAGKAPEPIHLELPDQPKVQELSKAPVKPQITSALAGTPKRGKRMANMLEAVLRPSKVVTPSSTKISKDKSEELKNAGESTVLDSVDAGPSESRPTEQVNENLSKKVSPGDFEFIIHHASGKQLTKKQITEAHHYAKVLKYPGGSLVYEGDEEDDFLYCLPHNKEIDICREMMDNMGYPKLELGISLMPKDHLADCLAYNSLKVCAYSFLRALDNHFE